MMVAQIDASVSKWHPGSSRSASDVPRVGFRDKILYVSAVWGYLFHLSSWGISWSPFSPLGSAASRSAPRQRMALWPRLKWDTDRLDHSS